MGYVSVKLETPRFVEYANAREYLQTLTPQALAWAKQFVGLALKGAGGSTWTAQEAWEQLRAHQEEFRGLLDAFIAERPTPEQMQFLTEHLQHVQPKRSWDGSPDQVREQAARRYEEPERWERLRQGLCAKGRGDIGAPPRRQPPSRYIQRINARDTLDGLCLELDQFLTNNGQNRLRKCSQCGRYFVQATARLKTYCMMSCQQKANPTKAQKNAAYQRTHRATQRERQLKADLQRVGKVKQEFITTTGAPPPVEDILARLHFGRRRWNMLVNWEMEQHDPPWVTDLTNKYCMRS